MEDIMELKCQKLYDGLYSLVCYKVYHKQTDKIIQTKVAERMLGVAYG